MRRDNAQSDRPARPAAPADPGALDAMMAELAGDQIDRILAEQEGRLVPPPQPQPQAQTDEDLVGLDGLDDDLGALEPLHQDSGAKAPTPLGSAGQPTPRTDAALADDALMAEMASDDIEALLTQARDQAAAPADALDPQAAAEDQATEPGTDMADDTGPVDDSLTDSDLQALLAAAGKSVVSEPAPGTDAPAPIAGDDVGPLDGSVTDKDIQALLAAAEQSAAVLPPEITMQAPARSTSPPPQAQPDDGRVSDEQLDSLLRQISPPASGTPQASTPAGSAPAAAQPQGPPMSEEDLEAALAAQQAQSADSDEAYPPLDPAELDAMIAQAATHANPDPTASADSAAPGGVPAMTMAELDDLLTKRTQAQAAKPDAPAPAATPHRPAPTPPSADQPAQAAPWQATPAPEKTPADATQWDADPADAVPTRPRGPSPLAWTLTAINRPFRGLSPRLRDMAGLVGFLLLIPALTLLLLTLLWPR